MILSLTPKQLRMAAAFALIAYAAIVAAIIAWVMVNAEETTKSRMAASPNVTVALTGEEPEVPSSWQAPSAETEAAHEAVPEAMPEAAASLPATEEKPAETPVAAETPVSVENKPTEKPPVTEPATPAVTVDPTATPIPTPSAVWHKFARPFDQKDQRPRIGLIVADLGMASAATQTAIQDLPGEVSLAFSSVAPDLEQWIGSARVAGHETILTIPMEPENYPQNDSGPNSLLLGLPDADNIDRLKRAMARAEGYVAVTPYMGEKFVTSEKKLIPILQAVKEQEVLILDGTLNRSSLIAPLSRYEKIPFVRSDMVIDAAASGQAIDVQLQNLEQLAREKGQAIGVALPYPVTFEKLKAWISTLEKKGLVLAPLTALASEEAPATVTTAIPAEVEAKPSTESLPSQP